ncbi:hypothetical protein NPIL_384081 [Nephila pilipes]|uniref:Uncharacterized protein n=1 Tax=Nephila pilipes TaxID=299642 RepID=A0A8X6TMM5_NEPPI|nr:hypothetical protein NPIL_384081 [Nephila pilipes]
MALQDKRITFTAKHSISRMAVLEKMRWAGFRRVIPFSADRNNLSLDMKITGGKELTIRAKDEQNGNVLPPESRGTRRKTKRKRN